MEVKISKVEDEIEAIKGLLRCGNDADRLSYALGNELAKPYRAFSQEKLENQLNNLEKKELILLQQSAPNQAKTEASSSEAGAGIIYL